MTKMTKDNALNALEQDFSTFKECGQPGSTCAAPQMGAVALALFTSLLLGGGDAGW